MTKKLRFSLIEYQTKEEEEILMEKNRENKGITLVALIVTIVILLILAGISISTLTNTRIFEKVQEEKRKKEEAELKQNIKLEEYENELDEHIRN